MKVLIADKFPEAGRTAVAQAGVEVVYDPELNDAALTAAVRSTARISSSFAARKCRRRRSRRAA